VAVPLLEPVDTAPLCELTTLDYLHGITSCQGTEEHVSWIGRLIQKVSYHFDRLKYTLSIQGVLPHAENWDYRGSLCP
jgi:hypothetical protein